MDTLQKNKQFVLEYFNAISGVKKTAELIDRYMNDQYFVQNLVICLICSEITDYLLG